MYVSTGNVITDFWLSWWLTVDVKSGVGFLHRVDIGGVADVPEIGAISIFRVKVFREGEFLCICRFILIFRKSQMGQWKLVPPSRPVGTVFRESSVHHYVSVSGWVYPSLHNFLSALSLWVWMWASPMLLLEHKAIYTQTHPSCTL